MIKSIIDFLSALLVPLIDIVTTYIAIQQWRADKKRFRLELYDRRVAVWNAVKTFHGEVGDYGRGKYSPALKLNKETAEAEFIFDEEITNHIENLFKKGMHLAMLHGKMYDNQGRQFLLRA
jgi:hypothetical protein